MRAFAIELRRVMSHLRFMGTLARWIEVVRFESDVDSGGPAVMESPNSGGSLDR